jgi:hypothetical protein
MPRSNDIQLAEFRMQLEQNSVEHKEIKDTLYKIDCKLDNVIEKKAEKEDLSKLDNRFWGLVVAILLMFAGWLWQVVR